MSDKETEKNFLNWLAGASIYIGYARYGQFGHGFVCATTYDENDRLQELVEDLSGGDLEAIDAAEEIKSMGCWFTCHENPATAMTELFDCMRKWSNTSHGKRATPGWEK